MAPILSRGSEVKPFIFILCKPIMNVIIPNSCFWQQEGAFLLILAAVKGSQAEKRLASQFITRFFKFFPKLQENAIDAMLDLCEDEDNMVSLRDKLTKKFLFYEWMKMYIWVSEILSWLIFILLKLMPVVSIVLFLILVRLSNKVIRNRPILIY